MERGVISVVAGFVIGGLVSADLVRAGEERSDARVKVMGVQRGRDKEKQPGGDSDDKIQHLGCVIKLKNESLEPVAGLQIEFTTFGECFLANVKNGELFAVLRRDKMTVDLGKVELKEVETPEFTSAYDTDHAKFGARYFAYLLVIRDSAGRLVLVDSDKSAWADKREALAGFVEKQVFTKKLEPSDAEVEFKIK